MRTQTHTCTHPTTFLKWSASKKKKKEGKKRPLPVPAGTVDLRYEKDVNEKDVTSTKFESFVAFQSRFLW